MPPSGSTTILTLKRELVLQIHDRGPTQALLPRSAQLRLGHFLELWRSHFHSRSPDHNRPERDNWVMSWRLLPIWWQQQRKHAARRSRLPKTRREPLHLAIVEGGEQEERIFLVHFER